jgi:hypothetical protein
MRVHGTKLGAISTGRGLGDQLYDLAGQVPSLDLNFAGTKTLDSRITFTRASSATYVGSDGLIKTATTDVPRFDHNPITGESLGLLVEEQRTNLMLQSEDFSTTWAVTRASVSTNAIAAPDGATTADKLVEDSTATNTHFVQQSVSVTSGTSYTSSVYVKAAERNFAQLVLSGQFATTVSAIFNLSTGAVGTTTGTPTTSATQLANGWWRLSVTQTASATGSTQVQVRVASSSTTATYTGDGTSGLYIWGAQLEAGAFPTSYIPTTSATVTRSADVASITGANFSPWYRQDEGTVYTAYMRQAIGTVTFAASLTETLSTSSANRIQLALNASNVPSYALVAAGTTQSILTPGGTAPNYVTAYGYKVDDVACSSSGSTVVTDTTAVMPTGVVYLNIGSNPANAGGFLNGTINRLIFWPQRLSNSTLQAITQ